MPEQVVTFSIVVLCALAIVPPLAIFVGTRSPEARKAREIAAGHAGVKARVGRVFFTFVRAAVFGPSSDGGHGQGTFHVWTIGTRGPVTVLVVFERADPGDWTTKQVLLRRWIPFVRPQELA